MKEAYEVDYHGYQIEGNKGVIFNSLYHLKTLLLKRKLQETVQHDSKVLDVGYEAGGFLEELKAIGVQDLTGLDFSQRAVDLLNL